MRRAAKTIGAVITTAILGGGIVSCGNETPTQSQLTPSHFVDPSESAFPSYLSTTGIPYIRTRMEGGGTVAAGTLTDMTEAGIAVGSRRDAGRLVAVAVNIRTGDTLRITNFAAQSQAKAINGRGAVVGGAPLPDPLQAPTAFYWNDGVRVDLGSGAGMDINDKGVAVGYAWDGNLTRPWVWRGIAVQFLGSDPGIAYGINEAGVIVGAAPIPGTGMWVPTIWKDGVAQPLFNFPGEATAINELGQVVGWAGHFGIQEAFVWMNGTVKWLGTLEGGPSQATAINDRGQIVGLVTIAGASRAVFWSDGRIIDLGLSGVPGEDVSEAFAITNSGQVIGRVGAGGGRNGVIWTPAAH